MKLKKYKYIYPFIGISLLIFVALTQDGIAQKHVEGKVISTQSGLVLPGAHVTLKDQNIITTTDESGYFHFSVDSSQQMVHLRISSVGFRTFEMQVYLDDLPSLLRIEMVPDTRQLQPVTVLAHRVKQDPSIREDVSSVIFKPVDSGAFLRNAPNVSGVRRGGFGIDPVIRGNSASRLNIRVDGLTSSAAACPNRMDPPTSHIRLSDIERVEIYHGPHALEFGPAFGGTVNFIKQKPGEFTGSHVQGDIRTGIETNTGHQIADTRLMIRNNRLSAILSGGLSSASDYESGSGTAVGASFTSYDYGLDLGYRLNKTQHIRAGWSQSFVRDADFPALPMDMAIDDTYKASVGYSWEPDYITLRSVSLDAYYTFVDHEMNNRNRESFQMRDAVALAETRSQGIRAQAKGFLNSGTWNITGNIDHQGIDGTRFVDFKMGPRAGESMQYNLWQDAYTTNFGLYAGGDYFRDVWTLKFGTRVDYNKADARNPAPRFQNRDLSSSFLNFSISAGLSRSLSDNTVISLYAGRGVRSPDVTERYINFLAIGRNPFEFAGNPDLKPEANHQADLIFDSHISRLQLTLNGFIGYTTDYISAEIAPEINPVGMGVPGVREFRNRGNIVKTGFETSVNFEVSSKFYLQWISSYTFAEYTDSGDAVAEIPPFEQSFIIQGLLANRFTPNLSVRQVSAQDRIDERFGEQPTSSFWLVDIYSGATLWNGFELAAGIRNLFNKNYEEHLNRNVNPEFDADRSKLFEPGRRIFIELSYSF
ncbi:MAG: TonB-dependent receptor [Balneolaceae bacterium]|nr:MAG: TonB-dependent receptor [Balneolaceae bacterium]